MTHESTGKDETFAHICASNDLNKRHVVYEIKITKTLLYKQIITIIMNAYYNNKLIINYILPICLIG